MSEDNVIAIYEGRKDYGYDRTEGRKMLAADWCVPLHRCLRRIYDLRRARPDLDPVIIHIWRDLDTAIGRSRILVQQLGVDTTSPLRRKPAAGNPEETRTEPSASPEETRTEPKANPEETRTEPKAAPEETRPSFPQNVIPSARPVRRTIASALVRLAAAICPTSDLRPLTSAPSPVAPPNETPKGPNP